VQARLAVPLVALCAALAVAGCGSSKKSSSSSNPSPATTAPSSTPTTTPSKTKGGATVKLSADPSGQLAFNTTSLSAKAGKVTLDMSNPAAVPHGIAVEGNGLDQKGPTVNQGGASTLTVTLKPGKYTFYCPVDQHKAAGMKGTLTVK